MDSPLQRVAQATGRGAETVVRTLVKQGEVAADRAERMIEDLLGRSEANRDGLVALVRSETERAVARLGLARQSEVDALRARLDALERGRAASGAGDDVAAARARAPQGAASGTRAADDASVDALP